MKWVGSGRCDTGNFVQFEVFSFLLLLYSFAFLCLKSCLNFVHFQVNNKKYARGIGIRIFPAISFYKVHTCTYNRYSY